MIVYSQGYGWYNSDYRLIEWGRKETGRQSDNAWIYYYDIIKQTNKIINNIDAVTNTAPADIENVKGQALGLRAYAYFYLINYEQQTYKGHETSPGVPIYTEDATEGHARGTVQDVYDLIIDDLTKAEILLTGKPRGSKTDVDVTVVQGFRARVALLMEDWPNAVTYAHRARQGYTLMVGPQYTDLSAFSAIANPEWMWGSLIPAAQATIYASFFSHMDVNTGGYAALGGQKLITKDLYDQINAGDIRKQVWTAPGTGVDPNVDYNQVKFQVPTPADPVNRWAADYLYMRAAEMYLIEAEGLARQGQDGPAQTVLQELVGSRFPAYVASAFSGQALINEILLQRRIELWGEGAALMDIKRLDQGLNRPTGPGNHGAPYLDPAVYTTSPADPRFLMRIPQRELDNNVNMTAADQNP